jgi:hypothetical protein
MIVPNPVKPGKETVHRLTRSSLVRDNMIRKPPLPVKKLYQRITDKKNSFFLCHVVLPAGLPDNPYVRAVYKGLKLATEEHLKTTLRLF